MEPIINSILDTDLYKLTQQQAVFHQYPNATVEYVFKCRNEGVKLGFLADQIQNEVNAMMGISLTELEEDYCKESLPFLTHDYIDYLKEYKFNPWDLTILDVDGDLDIRIKGLWASVILWEVPLLAIVNQLYFQETTDFKSVKGEGDRRLRDKMNLIRQYPTLTIAEFGTRRRYSGEWQKYVLKELVKNRPQVVGTSNVKLAMDLNIKAIGTVAHEWFSCHLTLVDNLEMAQKRAMHVWQQEYGTSLGIMLSDTFTVDAFFNDFDVVLAKAFSGVRHDSGCPFVFGEKTIAHYNKLGIDPKTKTIVFSDSLDVLKTIEIYKRFVGRIGVSFGIGTFLSNDMGCTPLNIVIKAIECNGKPVVKLSDNPSKAIGDKDMIEQVKKAYGVK
jgi:nicotinate phosphoribosyltransferase